MKDYYKILGVDEEASEEEIRARWVELTKHYHPDLRKTEKGEEKIREINEAYEVLKDEPSRFQYDFERDLKRSFVKKAAHHRRERETGIRKIVMISAGMLVLFLLVGFVLLRSGRIATPPVPTAKTEALQEKDKGSGKMIASRTPPAEISSKTKIKAKVPMETKEVVTPAESKKEAVPQESTKMASLRPPQIPSGVESEQKKEPVRSILPEPKVPANIEKELPAKGEPESKREPAPQVIMKPEVPVREEVSREVPKEPPGPVAKEIPKEVPKEAPKQVVSETPKEIPRELPKEALKGAAKIPREVPKEVTMEVPREPPKEVPKEIPKPIAMEIRKEVPKETPKPVVEKIPRDISREAPREVLPREIPKEREVAKEVSPKDVPPKTVPKETVKEVSLEAPKESPGRVPREVPKEVTMEVPREPPKEVPKEIPKPIAMEIRKEVPKETPKQVAKEVVKEVPKEAATVTFHPGEHLTMWTRGGKVISSRTSPLAREEEVKQFFSNYIDRYHRKDVDGFLSLFSPRAVQNQTDRSEAIRNFYTKFFNQSQDLRYQIEGMKINMSQYRVDVKARFRVDQKLKEGGEKVWAGSIRWVLVKEAGRLKISSLDYQNEKSP